MNEDQLRAMVREAVARHLGGRAAAPSTTTRSVPARQPSAWSDHPSHHVYLTVVNTTDACVIEPSVPCDHCGYCKSHGH